MRGAELRPPRSQTPKSHTVESRPAGPPMSGARTAGSRGPGVGPIVIAAGGTGGHFFPAEALAAALTERGQSVVLMTDARAVVPKSTVFPAHDQYVLPGAG